MIINSFDVKIYSDVAGTMQPLAYAKSASLSISVVMRDVSSFAGGKWRTVKPGRLNWTIQSNQFISFSSTQGFNRIYNALVNRTKIFVSFNCNGETYSGDVFVQDVNLNSSNDDGSFSFTAFGNSNIVVS
jgi:hypothetical protein